MVGVLVVWCKRKLEQERGKLNEDYYEIQE